MSSTSSPLSSESSTGRTHTANLLGALALALTDRTSDAVSATGDQTHNDAIALSALHHVLNRPSIDDMAQVLGLTHSGAVRLVDRLSSAGLVTREAGADGRTTAITLTAHGQARAHAVAQARARVLQDALTALSPEDHDTLDRLIGILLAGLIRGPDATRWICRLCDTHACGRPAGQCPVAEEARHRYP